MSGEVFGLNGNSDVSRCNTPREHTHETFVLARAQWWGFREFISPEGVLLFVSFAALFIFPLLSLIPIGGCHVPGTFISGAHGFEVVLERGSACSGCKLGSLVSLQE